MTPPRKLLKVEYGHEAVNPDGSVDFGDLYVTADNTVVFLTADELSKLSVANDAYRELTDATSAEQQHAYANADEVRARPGINLGDVSREALAEHERRQALADLPPQAKPVIG